MLFQPPNAPSVRLSMSTLYFQSLLYYDTIYTLPLLPFQLFLFIYKYNSLVYPTSTIAAEVILILVAFFLNALRLNQGKITNRNKSVGRYLVYVLGTVVMIIGFVYLIVWQPYVYWLEFILHLVAVVVLGVELLVSGVAVVAYNVAK